MSARAPLSASDSSSSEENTNSNGNLLLSKFESLSNDGPQRLILASQSPRRREILDMMGLTNRYTVTFSPLDEEALQIELVKNPIAPTEYAKKLAESKAFALAEHRAKDSDGKSDNSNKEIDSGHETTFILGSDTIVDKDGMILEKPKSEQQAVDILTRL
jgi:septum formation protein